MIPAIPLTTDWASIVNTILILALFVYGIKQWTGPVQDVQIRGLQSDNATLRGNLRRVERDLGDFQRTTMEFQEQILKEIRILSVTGVHNGPLERKVELLESRMEDAEQVLATLPCSVCGRSVDAT